jgi:hypothetical protein
MTMERVPTMMSAERVRRLAYALGATQKMADPTTPSLWTVNCQQPDAGTSTMDGYCAPSVAGNVWRKVAWPGKSSMPIRWRSPTAVGFWICQRILAVPPIGHLALGIERIGGLRAFSGIEGGVEEFGGDAGHRRLELQRRDARRRLDRRDRAAMGESRGVGVDDTVGVGRPVF